MSACWPNPACAHFSTVGKLKNHFLNISNGWKDLKWRTFVACETDMKFNYWRPQIKFYWHTATRSCSVLSVTASMPLWQLELSWFKTRVLPRMPQTCTIRLLPEKPQTNTRMPVSAGCLSPPTSVLISHFFPGTTWLSQLLFRHGPGRGHVLTQDLCFSRPDSKVLTLRGPVPSL